MKLRSKVLDQSITALGAFVGPVAFCVALFEFSTIAIKEVPQIRMFLMTGTQANPVVDAVIKNESRLPVIVTAVSEVPLRESPPEGIIPLKKGTEISEVKPLTEWVVVDSVKVKKLTGDDTWIRIANKNEADRVIPRYNRNNIVDLRAYLDQNSEQAHSDQIRNGWAYLGNNFILSVQPQ
jgi:hypothetical protein